MHVTDDSESDGVGKVFLRTLRNLLPETICNHVLKPGVQERFARQLRGLLVPFPQIAKNYFVDDVV